MKRTLVIVIVLGVVGLIIGGLFAAGFLGGPSNNPCPAAEACNNAVAFTIQVNGRVVNPTWSPPYATVDTISAYSGGAATLSFKVPKLDFWNNNYALTLNYCISYPSGTTYCTGKAFPVPPTQTGTVSGSGQVGWTFYLYHNGPRGSYSTQVTLSWTMTGCNLGATCASGTVTKGAGFSV